MHSGGLQGALIRGATTLLWPQEFWEKYEPPAALTNRYVLAATSVLSLGVAIYSAMHIRRARAAGVLSLVLFV